jgi:hypothetical protein
MKNSSAYWEGFYKDGIGYGDRVIGAGRAGKLNPDVVHGLAAMANEKMLMALLLYNGVHPEGHTFFDLIRAVAKICPFDESLKKSLLLIDHLLPLCSLDPAPPVVLNDADLEMVINSVARTRDYVDNALGDHTG